MNIGTRIAASQSMMNQNPVQDSTFDLKKIRKDAVSSLEKRAVTQEQKIDLQKTYQLLNNALAGEILCVLRYTHHAIIAKGIDFPQVAAEFKEHALNEQQHMMMIAERIDQLGGDPDLNPATITARSPCEYGSPAGSDLESLIKENLVAERIAIEIYRGMVKYFGDSDPTSRRLFEQILADEEEHATDLSDLLAKA